MATEPQFPQMTENTDNNAAVATTEHFTHLQCLRTLQKKPLKDNQKHDSFQEHTQLSSKCDDADILCCMEACIGVCQFHLRERRTA